LIPLKAAISHSPGGAEAMTNNNQSLNETEEEIVVQKEGNSYILTTLNGKVGEITYRLVDVDTWIIDHTFLEPQYRGSNLGRELLDLVVDEAREKGRKIIPSCAFALEQFKQNPEYADVWEKDHTKYSDPYSTDSAVTSKD
jgi:predicted GNAT family acetyltransferase